MIDSLLCNRRVKKRNLASVDCLRWKKGKSAVFSAAACDTRSKVGKNRRGLKWNVLLIFRQRFLFFSSFIILFLLSFFPRREKLSVFIFYNEEILGQTPGKVLFFDLKFSPFFPLVTFFFFLSFLVSNFCAFFFLSSQFFCRRPRVKYRPELNFRSFPQLCRYSVNCSCRR